MKICRFIKCDIVNAEQCCEECDEKMKCSERCKLNSDLCGWVKSKEGADD